MPDLAQARRVVELMVLSAWADGHVEGSEALTIHKLAAGVPLLREVGPTGDISAQAKERLEKLGLAECVKQAAAGITDPKYRELAFQCCAKVAGADNLFVPEEAEVLSVLQQLYGFGPDDVRRLLVLATH